MGADIFQDIDSDRVGFDVNENIVHRKAGVNRWLSPVSLTAGEIASPTAAILADTSATYIGPNGVRYFSNGVDLFTEIPAVPVTSSQATFERELSINGCVGNGSADDHAALTAAMDAVKAIDGLEGADFFYQMVFLVWVLCSKYLRALV